MWGWWTWFFSHGNTSGRSAFLLSGLTFHFNTNLKICVQVSLILSLFDFQLTQPKLLLSNLLHLCALLGKCYQLFSLSGLLYNPISWWCRKIFLQVLKIVLKACPVFLQSGEFSRAIWSYLLSIILMIDLGASRASLNYSAWVQSSYSISLKMFYGCIAPAFDEGELDALARACYYYTVASARHPRSDPIFW